MEMQSRLNQEWIELLSQGNHREEIRFYDTMKDSPSLELAIMGYRRILRESENRGEGITLEDLKSNMDNRDKLRDLFQEMFIEPVSDGGMDFFFETVKEKYKNLEEGILAIYLKHKESRNERFLNRVLVM